MNRFDRRTSAGWCAAGVLLTVLPVAGAHEGHDHRESAAAATAARTPADPMAPDGGVAPAGERFSATSDRFELVGVLEGSVLTLYLDGFADNVPVENARIELEVGAEKVVAQPQGDVYRARLSAPPAAGTTLVTALVVAGDVSDLLAAELEWAGPPASVRSSPPPGLPIGSVLSATGSTRTTIGAALAAAVVAGAIGWTAARRRSRT